jgi:hypothetical protein
MYQVKFFPFKDTTFKENGINNNLSLEMAMLLKPIRTWIPLRVGFDKWTNSMYANKGIYAEQCELFY